MPSGAKPKYGWETVSRNIAELPHGDWVTEAEAVQATGFSAQSLQGFAAAEGNGPGIIQRSASGRDRKYNRGWLYIKLADLYGAGWRDVLYDDPDRLATVRSLLAQWWAEPQPALIDTLSPLDLRPPPAQDVKMVYNLSEDPARERGRLAGHGVIEPLHVLTCQTCGTHYDGHPGASTECRRCRSRTALLKMHERRRAAARGAPPPGQHYPANNDVVPPPQE